MTDHHCIETERLRLRQPREDDQACLERAFCDAAMMKYLGSVWSAETVAESIGEWRDLWGADGMWFGVLETREQNEPVGAAGFTRDTVDGEPGLELSWFVLPEYQGRGFATEITRALVRFAFTTLEDERMLAETHPDNPAANRLLAKLGFTCLGERHHQYDYLPEFTTQVLWALTRADWLRGAQTEH